ncbi:MAG: hypothetical protein KDD11_11915 [Acidobacteria bacterium]|nr:hypothetical protein [Acidobacteriota bacterium]
MRNTVLALVLLVPILGAGATAHAQGGEVPAPPPAVAHPLLAPLTDDARIGLTDLDPSVPSPADFLGYSLGSRFTRHFRVEDYLERLAASSDRVRLERYGETYEGRPLYLVTISTAENIARLDELRADAMALAHPQDLSMAQRTRLLDHHPVIVWLAYGVHGNESSSTETSLAVAYTLAAARGDLADALSQVVVILDPLVNPDGRERYLQGYLERRGREPDAAADSMEHVEEWPGGRFNHYLFDLNRDWTWMTQQETEQRIAAYRRWEPQVYADFHEMGPDSSYFFPPPAQPVLRDIDRRTVAWIDTFGRANGSTFDFYGWLYYKAEVFDLFYPGYGDSYPSLRGAVGMTYEVAGGGRGGQVVERRDGRLTLADRIARHFTTSLATVVTAAKNRRALLSDFVASRTQPMLDPVSTFFWKPEDPESRSLADLLRHHGIEVRRLARGTEVSAVEVSSGKATTVQLPAGSYTVSTAQPLGGLARTLLSREAEMPASFLERQRERIDSYRDTEFADITAWSLPLAYGVEAWMMSGEPEATEALEPPVSGLRGKGDYAFLVPPQGYGGYRFAAGLERREVVFRLALESFDLGGESFPGGTLVIPALGNPPELAEILEDLARTEEVQVVRVATAFTDRGISLGSDQVIAVSPARIGLLGGPGVARTAHGALWHLFDRQLGLRFSRLQLDQLGRIDLDGYDVLVFPGGDAEGTLDEGAKKRLAGWVEDGGLLVTSADALGLLHDLELSSVEEWQPEGHGTDAGESTDDPEAPAMAETPPGNGMSEGDDETHGGNVADRPLDVPGAAVATDLRSGSPLGTGMRHGPATLILGDRVLEATGDPRQDVLTVRANSPVIAGFAWPESAERLAGSLLTSVETAGRGRVVIFAQMPPFRGFWRATTPLLLNAVLYGPSMIEAGALP